jgi:hypothetical protein
VASEVEDTSLGLVGTAFPEWRAGALWTCGGFREVDEDAALVWTKRGSKWVEFVRSRCIVWGGRELE